MSAWGSTMRIFATRGEWALPAGSRPSCQYESGMDERSRVLVVDDDHDIRLLLKELLDRAGYDVDEAPDGRTALRRLYERPPALVILDVTMPEMDGYQTLERIRDLSDVPVIMLTARSQELEKVRGLSAGADDYVAKPFRMEEVLARLRALIRRASGQMTPELRCGSLALDARLAKVTVDGAPVKLTSHEFRVLSYLMHHRGRVVSQGELIDHIYAQHFDRDSNTVEVFIARLRRKLGGSFIETVRGFGYRIEDGP